MLRANLSGVYAEMLPLIHYLRVAHCAGIRGVNPEIRGRSPGSLARRVGIRGVNPE